MITWYDVTREDVTCCGGIHCHDCGRRLQLGGKYGARERYTDTPTAIQSYELVCLQCGAR